MVLGVGPRVGSSDVIQAVVDVVDDGLDPVLVLDGLRIDQPLDAKHVALATVDTSHRNPALRIGVRGAVPGLQVVALLVDARRAP